MSIRIEEIVAVQPPAFQVPLGFPDAMGIPWTALANAKVGDRWYENPPSGGWGGEAVVVWRDETRVVVLHRNYRDAGYDDPAEHMLRAYEI